MNESSNNRIMKTSAVKRFLLLGRLGNGTKSEAITLWCAIVPFCFHAVSAAIIIAVMCAILFDAKERAKAFSDREFSILSLCISGFSMLSSIISLNLIGMAISFGVFAISLIAGYIKAVINGEIFRKATVIIALGSCVALVTELFQKFVVYPDGDLYRPTAGAFNANYLGALVVMAALIALVRIFDGEEIDRQHKWYDPPKFFWALIFVVNVLSLLICESRSSLLSLTVCVVVFMFLKKYYMLCGAVAVCGGGIWLLGWLKPELLSWTNSLTYIFTERMVIWKNALASFAQNPYTALVGRGPMTYFHVMEKEQLFVANHAHNLLFDSLLNVGVIGTALYGLIALKAVKIGFKKHQSGDKNGFILSVLILVQIMVQGMADVTIMWHQCAILAVLIALAKYEKEVLE